MQKNKIFNSVKFVTGINNMDSCPLINLPEIAFWGRSNVGKSSAINALCGSNKIAKISKTPGRTQQINLFVIGNNQFMIADLPGYGYAKVSKKISDNLYHLCYNYLASKRAKIFLLLIDARRGLMESDQEVIKALLFYNYRFILVLTKSDLLTKEAIKKIQDTIVGYRYLMISSSKNLGLIELQQLILENIL